MFHFLATLKVLADAACQSNPASCVQTSFGTPAIAVIQVLIPVAAIVISLTHMINHRDASWKTTFIEAVVGIGVAELAIVVIKAIGGY